MLKALKKSPILTYSYFIIFFFFFQNNTDNSHLAVIKSETTLWNKVEIGDRLIVDFTEFN